MARTLSENDIKAIGQKTDQAARQAAGEKLKQMIPFENVRGSDPKDPLAPKEANIGFPNSTAHLGFDPKADPNDIDFSVSSGKQPIVVPEIEQAIGRYMNPETGRIILDPREVGPALGALAGADINKNKAEHVAASRQERGVGRG